MTQDDELESILDRLSFLQHELGTKGLIPLTKNTLRDSAKDAALVKKLDEKYSDYAKQVYTLNQQLLDTAVDYGLISKQVATDLKKKYPEYVPFSRIFDRLEGKAEWLAYDDSEGESIKAVRVSAIEAERNKLKEANQ